MITAVPPGSPMEAMGNQKEGIAIHESGNPIGGPKSTNKDEGARSENTKGENGGKNNMAKAGSDVVNEKRKTESEEDQSVIEVISEVEEGEIKETWADVTPGKGSRSPNLKFGQVKILTPSRYSALLQVDENGETINQVDYEEILSIEEEVVTVEFTDGRVVEEKSVPKELKNSEEGDTRGQNTKTWGAILLDLFFREKRRLCTRLLP
ncbi:Uncharacterized protein Rs2_09048 [Raphanus sativus]|nr:Uncharacterized protein Rs2_09048 [Raphanus sativus]